MESNGKKVGRIDRLERDDGGDDKQHFVPADEADERGSEAQYKKNGVDEKRIGRTDPTRGLERHLAW